MARILDRKVRGLEVMTYQAIFERADDGSVFAYVPDLPGCTSWGSSLDDARENVQEAIGLWLAAVRSQGGEPPQPTTIVSVPIETDAAFDRGMLT